MPPFYALISFVALQRLVELAISRRNHRALLANGGIEFGRPHYRLVVAFHAGWLLALIVAIPPQAPIDLPLLVFFGLLQCARVWVMASLGRLWTTRVILRPGSRRVRSGPYRFLSHPAYLIVSLELAVVPLMFGAWPVALASSILNQMILRTRLRVENQALAEVYGN